ncbi:TetR family transcriptional regulator [Prauserella marina]|uniref:DNA-binding transcriptional regulator, AcrR family n=1 Tax=Prauserella marina TaxID=530584 RepID=A0A222VWV0_9PSEU|nr:TetR/AcrR family transcriptional regulator [Prauserella marina]ASR38183.1 TetR family transcriptional regulator [Prauserella marina]PWV78641.1 TetR family transcriptional regulator [Prauserella marina]SDC90584.1 DNA-binding transcriptional regulator, AcrR family [Prauserella marina]
MSPEARSDELISAALELFATRSPGDVTVDDVTARAGVSRPLFYRYFRGVGELRLTALRRVVDGLLTRLAEVGGDSPRQRLCAAVTVFADVAEEHRAGYVALLRHGSAVATSDTGAIIDEVRRRAVDLILTETEVADPSPMLLTTLRCWTAVVEEAMLNRLREGDVPKAVLGEWLVDQLVAMAEATARHDPGRATTSGFRRLERKD